MAELPAQPAPVAPVVVDEEPARGVVPADAELQPPPVVEAEVFFLLIVFGFFRFLAPRVSVLQCLLYVRLVSSLGFLCLCAFISGRVLYSQLYLLFCTLIVLFCTLLVLC